MPYVRIEITDGATYEQKLQIYKETTEMLVRILNKKPEYTFVVIEEVDNKNWGHMGTSVAKIREAEAREREKAQAAAGDFAAAAVTDRCFHAEIVRSGGNDILSRLYDQLRDRQLRMGVAVMHSHPDRIAKTLAEHEEILDALRSGDAEAAVGIVHRHVSWFSNLARGEVR